MKPVFFKTGAALRKWFAANPSATELVIGFYKKASGRESVTYDEALDEALCVGWIDGIRRRVDEASYTIRFTPRRPRSIWSNVNIAKVRALIERGVMKPAGLTAFEARDPARSGVYSFEHRNPQQFPPKYERLFRANAKAWHFFTAQPPHYQRTTTWYVISAKKEETQLKRLQLLIDHAVKREWIPGFLRPAPRRTAQKRTRT